MIKIVTTVIAGENASSVQEAADRVVQHAADVAAWVNQNRNGTIDSITSSNRTAQITETKVSYTKDGNGNLIPKQ